jgi:transcriptional antiterminator RfaH
MRGVESVVSFGGNPTPIDDEIINFIKSQIREDGLARVGQPISVGDQVVIKDGIFKNLIGIFDREAKGSDRVLILLANVNYHGHVAIERERIRRVV